jgi:signal transduction histidine kinase
MVPIRRQAPIGAIGNYWSRPHRADAAELALLQALADSTAIAMENVAVHAELERRVSDRTSELERANHELATKHDALVELQRQRESLSALVVHDLKSPASAIMLAASLRLRRGEPSDPACRDWKRVLSSAQQIHRTALNLLDVAACVEGKLIPRPSEVDVPALFAEVSELLAPQAERRGTTIETEIDLGDTVVRADPELLRRVLQNLLDNAVRHGPANGRVQLEAHATPDGFVKFAISDTGPGIPAELRERLLAPRSPLEHRAEDGGVCYGLGLTYCRLAVEAHGGRIWIEDNDPHGLRFCFSLPAS